MLSEEWESFEKSFALEVGIIKSLILSDMRANPLNYSRVWNKRTPLNKHSPLENLAKRIIVAPFFTLYYEVRNKAVAPGKKSKN